MISFIEALNFRSLHDVQQEVGRFQTLVGPNGSGKSTFLDVPAFLGDLLRVGLQKAVVGDGVQVQARAADPTHLRWMREGGRFELAIELIIPQNRALKVNDGRYARVRYEVAIQTGAANGETSLAAETLWLLPKNGANHKTDERTLFPLGRSPRSSIVRELKRHTPEGWRKVLMKVADTGNDYFFSETSNWNNPFRLGPAKSALANLPEDEDRFPIAIWVKRVLMEGIQRVMLNAQAMRRPSPPGASRHFLPDGSNLPWVIEVLRESNPTRFERWIEHMRTALPDIKTVTTVERGEDRHRYLVIEYNNGLRAPSWVISDGTLRMLALTLLAYIADQEGVYLIEEPENGIHPRAIETVYQSLSSVYDAQVFCASHSPVVLGLAKPDELLCFAKSPDGATDIVRGSEHPRLRDWKGALDLGTLFAAGVLG